MLHEIGADDVRMVIAWNKIDLTEAGRASSRMNMVVSRAFA